MRGPTNPAKEEPGRLPTDRPRRPDDVWETEADTKAREFEEWQKSRRTLTDDQVRAVRKLLPKMGDQAISTKLGISKMAVRGIRDHGTYADVRDA